MSNAEIKDASRVSRRFSASLIVGWLFVVVVLPILAPTFNLLSVADLRLGFALIVPIALFLFAVLAVIFARRFDRQAGDGSVSASFVIALQALGAGGLVASVAAISTLGFDGLALPSGIVAGVAMLTIFLLPRFAVYPVRNFGEFFEMRFGQWWVWPVAAAVIGLATIPLLAANIQALGAALQGVFGLSFTTAVPVATALVVFVAVYSAVMRWACEKVFAIAFAFVCLVIALVVGAIAFQSTGSLLSAVLFGPTIVERAELEQKLISSGLADFSSLVPMTSPFLNWSAVNYISVALAVALGTAVLPNVVRSTLSAAAKHGGTGRSVRRTARAVVWLAIFALLFAPFAVHARLGVLKQFEAGIDVSAMPGDFMSVHAKSWASLCGSSAGASATAIAAACNTDPDSGTSLRLQDLNMQDEAWVLAGPMLSGLPGVFSYLLWIAVGLAALLVGQSLLSAAASSRRGRSDDNQSLSGRHVISLGVLAVAGLALVLSRQMGFIAFVTDGLALFAAGLFPALTLALYWRGMNAIGAVAAMVTGFGLLVIYIVGVRFFPFEFYEWTSMLSAAGQQGLTEIELFKEQIATAASSDERLVLVNDLDNYVRAIANWGGLIPPAGVLFAIPLSLFAGLFGSLVGRYWLRTAEHNG